MIARNVVKLPYVILNVIIDDKHPAPIIKGKTNGKNIPFLLVEFVL